MSINTLGATPQRLRGRWLGLAALTMSGLVLGLDITILVTAPKPQKKEPKSEHATKSPVVTQSANAKT